MPDLNVEGNKDKGTPPVVEETPPKEIPAETTPPVEAVKETPAENVEDVIAFMQDYSEGVEAGSGERIKSIPPELVGGLGHISGSLNMLRELFADPEMQDMFNDMKAQKEEGKVPSFRLAIARTLPLEDLTGKEGDEDFKAMQQATADRIAGDEATAKGEETALENWTNTEATLDAYAEKMALTPEQKTEFEEAILGLMEAMGEGRIDEATIDRMYKGGNYDKDMAVREAPPVETAILPNTPSGGGGLVPKATEKKAVVVEPTKPWMENSGPGPGRTARRTRS